ncbi:MAG TPA: gamma-glutamyltransferase [Gemmataceae bacterium]|nr:gamma-glutamyltransferase [Gemmataceae bacterium]
MFRRIVSSLSALLASVAIAPGQDRPPTGRLTPQPYKTGRSVVMAKNGMVATSQALATQIGLDVLRRGGTAVDAAIATDAALGLMEPMSCGLGGDLYAIVWDNKTQKLCGLNASGRSPYRATRDFFSKQGLKEIPEYGPLSWSVPGCASGWDELHRKFGKLPLADILAPTIEYAENGFPVTEVIAGFWDKAKVKLSKTPEAAGTYLPGGRAPRAGDVFKNPNLARVYRSIAKDGPGVFYKGWIADKIVAYSDKVGGLFGPKDFADHTATWVEPVSTTYRSYQVWELPPPGQGIAVLEMLNLLSAYDLKKMGPKSADYWHLFVEAKKLAYADRARCYADPDFAKLPTAELISMPYADRRRKLIDPTKARTDQPAGDPKLGASDTIYLCVVDKDRNCVSFIQSNYHGFGSQHVPGDLGFALQNRGALFALDQKHMNRLEPHKRPFHTIIPALVTKDNKPFLVFGVMGGDFQAQGHVEVLVNMLDFGMNVQEAGEAPRIEHVGSPTPTGKPGDPNGGQIKPERGIPPAMLRELERRGHRIGPFVTNGGGYQAILIDPVTGMLHGGSEPRKDGCAVGY